jgi:hypothetical protein
MISTVDSQVYIPVTVYDGYIYPTSWKAFVIEFFLKQYHSDRVEIESQYTVICSSFMAKDVEYFFTY